jgi:hypothetical protein
MAALYPIRLASPQLSATAASHRNQMPPSKRLAGGGAHYDRLLVLKGRMCSMLHLRSGQKNEKIQATAFRMQG